MTSSGRNKYLSHYPSTLEGGSELCYALNKTKEKKVDFRVFKLVRALGAAETDYHEDEKFARDPVRSPHQRWPCKVFACDVILRTRDVILQTRVAFRWWQGDGVWQKLPLAVPCCDATRRLLWPTICRARVHPTNFSYLFDIWETGEIPEAWKTAFVVSVLKPGKPEGKESKRAHQLHLKQNEIM